MSSDNVQRQIEFILEQQAKFSEDMLMLKDALVSLTHIIEQQGERGRETDARLDRLIDVVERHISGHNGKETA